MSKLREFIWERCEGDVEKTDEIMRQIQAQLPTEEEITETIKSYGDYDGESYLYYPEDLGFIAKTIVNQITKESRGGEKK